MKRAISEFRNVTVTFNDAVGQDIVDQTAQIASGIDAYKAALGFVEEYEGKYALDSANVGDLSAVDVILTGTNPYQIHAFTVTVDISAASYNFIFVETVPTVDDLS